MLLVFFCHPSNDTVHSKADPVSLGGKARAHCARAMEHEAVTKEHHFASAHSHCVLPVTRARAIIGIVWGASFAVPCVCAHAIAFEIGSRQDLPTGRRRSFLCEERSLRVPPSVLPPRTRAGVQPRRVGEEERRAVDVVEGHPGPNAHADVLGEGGCMCLCVCCVCFCVCVRVRVRVCVCLWLHE